MALQLSPASDYAIVLGIYLLAFRHISYNFNIFNSLSPSRIQKFSFSILLISSEFLKTQLKAYTHTHIHIVEHYSLNAVSFTVAVAASADVCAV